MKAIRSLRAPRPSGAYSQGIEAGSFLFSAGMGPHDPATGEVVGEAIEEQTARTLENLSGLLGEVGMSLADVVKVTAYLARLEHDFQGYDLTYRSYFSEPYPVRTTVGAQLAGILIEVDVVAIRDRSRA
jgi:2-iminobutanoate/2-iminopropanoate deaminase